MPGHHSPSKVGLWGIWSRVLTLVLVLSLLIQPTIVARAQTTVDLNSLFTLANNTPLLPQSNIVTTSNFLGFQQSTLSPLPQTPLSPSDSTIATTSILALASLGPLPQNPLTPQNQPATGVFGFTPLFPGIQGSGLQSNTQLLTPSGGSSGPSGSQPQQPSGGFTVLGGGGGSGGSGGSNPSGLRVTLGGEVTGRGPGVLFPILTAATAVVLVIAWLSRSARK